MVKKCRAWKMNFVLCSFSFYNRYIFMLGVTFLLFSSTTVGAPLESSKTDDWWQHPCTAQMQQLQLRHARSGRSPVDTQFQIFFIKLNSIAEKIKTLYPNVPQSKMRSGCPKINVTLRLIKQASNKKKANHIFYESLVAFSQFIHKLRNVPIETDTKFNVTLRSDIYDEMSVNMRNVLCEFSENLERRFKLPNRKDIPIKMIQKRMNNEECVPDRMSLSEAQIIDVDIVKKLKTFMRKGRQLSRKFVKKNLKNKSGKDSSSAKNKKTSEKNKKWPRKHRNSKRTKAINKPM